MRVILLVHRYLAVSIGVVMTLWCLPGFVMMYQDYPAFSEEERLRALQPLDLSGCVMPGNREQLLRSGCDPCGLTQAAAAAGVRLAPAHRRAAAG